MHSVLAVAAFGAGPAAVVGVLAAAVLAWAWRGRRVDDHPLCRRCGFDQFGRPGGCVCTECGADLTRRRALRIGHRQKRRRLIGAVLPLLIVCGAWIGAVGWGRARGVDWNRHKPLWLLEREAAGANAAARDAAVTELARRLSAGLLPAAVEQSLEDRALALQADLKLPWVPAWGELLEQSGNAGRLSKEQWERYVAQSLALSLEARPKVRRGDPLPVRVKWGPTRVGKASFPLLVTLEWDVAVGHARTGLLTQGRVAPRQFQVGPGPSGGGVYAEGLCDLDHLLKGMSNGKHTVRVAARVDGKPNLRRQQTPISKATEVTLEAPWELVPPDQPTVHVTDDPSHREAVEAALKLYGMHYATSPTAPARLWGYVDSDAPPVPLCYEAHVRVGFSRLRCGEVMLSPLGQGGRSPVLTEVPGPPLEARTVDLILTPSPQRAARTVDVTEIWGVPIVFRDVPVTYDGGS